MSEAPDTPTDGAHRRYRGLGEWKAQADRVETPNPAWNAAELGQVCE
jgi:hypothetical protein